MSDKNTKKIAINRDLILLFIGQSVSSIGNSFTGIALTWFIVSTGTPFQVGVRLALGFLPNIIFAPFVGNLVDRMSRKLLVWGSDILRLVLDLILILIISLGYFNLYIIYAYTFIQAVIRLFFEPAKRSMIQQLTTDEQRVKANALQDVFLRVGMVIGPALAGIAVKFWPKQLVVAFDALTFLIAALIVLTIKLNEQHLSKSKKNTKYFQHMAEGWSYVKKHSWILYLSIGYCFCNGGNMLIAVSRQVFIKQVLQLGPDAFGYLTSAGSLGAIFVAMLLVKVELRGHKLNYSIIAVLVWSIGVMLFYFVQDLTQMIIIQFIAFSLGPIMMICGSAFYQKEIAPEYMGRVYAVRAMITSLAMPVGSLCGGLVIKLAGIRGSFIVSGLVVLLCALFIYIAKQVHQRQTQQHNNSVGEAI